MNPPLPSEISAYRPPSPSEFPVTFRGGGGDGYFLEPHNIILLWIKIRLDKITLFIHGFSISHLSYWTIYLSN